MSEPLGALLEQFLKEWLYLKAVTPKTMAWYRSAWKAFEASQMAAGELKVAEATLTKAQLQDCRHPPVRPRRR